MNNNIKFDITKLKGKLGAIRNWMSDHNLPPRMAFYLLGIISTIWFLFRVIPKPSRAGYPCMKVAAPFMSGFVLYLLTLGGIMVALRKARQNIFRTRYIATGAFLFAAAGGMVFTLIQGSQNANALVQSQNKLAQVSTGPDDGPNQPIGTGVGVNPGRVIWAWDVKATNENCINNFYSSENTNQQVVSQMFNQSVQKLSEKNNSSESWDELFRNFNYRKKNIDKGYTQGEKIFIKINQTSTNSETCQTNPYIVLEILRQLANVLGIDQANISVGDPQRQVNVNNYENWVAEFPNVIYADKRSSDNGRTLIHPTSKELVFYSDKTQSDKIYDIMENADYLINVANLKPHSFAGITLTAKNHFGSQSRQMARHLHYSHVIPMVRGNPSNSGYRKYRVMVDLMGSKYLGMNTLLYVVDGLFGGGYGEGGPPVKYFSTPFNNDWSNSVFISQDQVALESVCYDFLRTEWNGSYTHDKSNATYETIPNIRGVDDYLHQAADSTNWPAGIIYDPDNSGKPLASLGIHEHWNNSEKKLYSRNLGKSYGIELISIPESLEKIAKKAKRAAKLNPATIISPVISENKPAIVVDEVQSENSVSESKSGKGITVIKRPFNEGFRAKQFNSAIAGANGVIWFTTELGLASFDGKNWTLHNSNSKIPTQNLKIINNRNELWIATPHGVTVSTIPINDNSNVTTYNSTNSTIISDNVLAVATGRGLVWMGTDKGISALYNEKWLSDDYQKQYPENLFKDYPINAMATSTDGDSLYVATSGAGVFRVYRNMVDGISGASEYAEWGPIEIPSDNVYSIFINSDGIQWFGTDKGAGRHIGYNTLENWTIFNTDNGLVDNFVQAIASDLGENLWFGTKGGVSVFKNTGWTSYTIDDGLISNNIKCIVVDRTGLVYLGTDNGVMIFNDGQFICYQSNP